jgi:hypothetical protein
MHPARSADDSPHRRTRSSGPKVRAVGSPCRAVCASRLASDARTNARSPPTGCSTRETLRPAQEQGDSTGIWAATAPFLAFDARDAPSRCQLAMTRAFDASAASVRAESDPPGSVRNTWPSRYATWVTDAPGAGSRPIPMSPQPDLVRPTLLSTGRRVAAPCGYGAGAARVRDDRPTRRSPPKAGPS